MSSANDDNVGGGARDESIKEGGATAANSDSIGQDGASSVGNLGSSSHTKKRKVFEILNRSQADAVIDISEELDDEDDESGIHRS